MAPRRRGPAPKFASPKTDPDPEPDEYASLDDFVGQGEDFTLPSGLKVRLRYSPANIDALLMMHYITPVLYERVMEMRAQAIEEITEGRKRLDAIEAEKAEKRGLDPPNQTVDVPFVTFDAGYIYEAREVLHVLMRARACEAVMIPKMKPAQFHSLLDAADQAALIMWVRDHDLRAVTDLLPFRTGADQRTAG